MTAGGDSGVEGRVAAHYGRGGLYDRIIEGLTALGLDPAAATAADLKPVDEFHIGGVRATDDLADQLTIGGGARVLDIGAGLGGTARHLAARFGAEVTGVDLTPEYVETAERLSALVGAAGVDFRVGSALALPVDDGAYDIATMIHVGMNIADKAGLMAEARRALRPGGTFALYEVMRAGDPSDLVYPLPWAETPETSFVAPLADYVAAAEAAGFRVVAARGRRAFAQDFFAAFARTLAGGAPPPLGLALLMGPTAPRKVANMIANIDAGRIEPTELILRAP